jgi:hypothetical protein
MKSTTPLLLLSTLLTTTLSLPLAFTTGNADKEVGPGTWIPLDNYVNAVEKREAHGGAIAPATISFDISAAYSPPKADKHSVAGNADREVGPGTWIPLGNYVDVVEKRSAMGNADKEVGPGTWIPLGNYVDTVEKRSVVGNADKEVGPGMWIPIQNYKDAVEKREPDEGAVAPATMSYTSIAYNDAEEK